MRFGCPRVRGDIPQVLPCDHRTAMLSPCKRGYSRATLPAMRCRVVVPVYAGVFPKPTNLWEQVKRCPRVRGGIPEMEQPGEFWGPLSPCTRGYSLIAHVIHAHDIVVPVYAGVFRWFL